MTSKADTAAKSKDGHSGPVIIKAHNLKNRVPLSSLANVGCKKESNSWITNATVYPKSDSTSAMAKPSDTEPNRASASNSVEFALQSLFNSDTSIIVSTPSPKLSEAVEKILKSPETRDDDDLTIVFDSYAQPNASDAKLPARLSADASAKTKVLILRKKNSDLVKSAAKGGNLAAKCSKPIKYDLVNGKSVESTDKRNPKNTNTAMSSSTITNARKDIKIEGVRNNTFQGATNADKEGTYVQVENELEKMFAGIEDTSVPVTKLNLSAAANNVSSNSQPSRNKNSFNSVNIAAKSNRKTVPKNSKPVKGAKNKQNSSKESKSIDSMKKIPMIHIEGSKQNPLNAHIVNSIKSEEEESSSRRTSVKRKSANSDPAVKTTTSNFAVKNHDTVTSDPSWVCIFCNLSANVQGLAGEAIGDLFGPYFIRMPNQINSNESQVQVRRTTHPEQAMKKHKGSPVDLPPSDEQKSVEVWAHENCIVWASGVHLIGSKLIGLEEAVMQALETICAHCKNRGASIGCRARNCNSCAHCSCALHTGWRLDPETFISTCRTHSARPNA